MITMNKKYKIQSIILLSIGILLSPALYLTVWILILSSTSSANAGGDGNLALVIYLIVSAPLAFISLICLIFGVRRLTLARRQPVMFATKEYQHNKRDLSVLAIGTVLLSFIGITMLIYVIYTLLQGDTFQLILTSTIPIIVVILAIVFVPINIRKISKQKKALLEQQGTVQSEKF